MSFKILRHYAPLRQIIAKGHLPLLRWAHQHRSFSPRLSSYDAHGYSSSSRVTPAATLPTDEIPRLQAQLDLCVFNFSFNDDSGLSVANINSAIGPVKGVQ